MTFSRKSHHAKPHSSLTKPTLEYHVSRHAPDGGRVETRIKKTTEPSADVELLDDLMRDVDRQRIALPADEAPTYRIVLMGKKTPRTMEFGSRGLYECMPKENAAAAYEALDNLIERNQVQTRETRHGR